jgi:hypothetical protein
MATLFALWALAWRVARRAVFLVVAIQAAAAAVPAVQVLVTTAIVADLGRVLDHPAGFALILPLLALQGVAMLLTVGARIGQQWINVQMQFALTRRMALPSASWPGCL